MLKRIAIGVAIGTIMFFLKQNVLFALTNTRDIVEINSNYSTTNGNPYTFNLKPNISGDMFLYDNQYFSDRKINNYYILGYFNYYNSSSIAWNYISNINFYFPNSCNSNEYANYNIRIRFYSQDNSKAKPVINSGLSTCSGTIEDIGSNNFDYILNCNIQPGNAFAGSIYMNNLNFGPVHYRVSIQKNFNYSCEINSQAIIENQNINTDRTIQAITDMNGNISIVNNSITQVNDTILDSSIDSSTVSSDTSQWSSMNAQNGTITNLLTLPIQLLQAYVNGINSSCSSISLGSLLGTEIIMPCINISNLIGSNLYSVIDVLFSGFMIFSISKKLIKIFNDFTNMKSNQIDELYGGGA